MLLYSRRVDSSIGRGAAQRELLSTLAATSREGCLSVWEYNRSTAFDLAVLQRADVPYIYFFSLSSRSVRV